MLVAACGGDPPAVDAVLVEERQYVPASECVVPAYGELDLASGAMILQGCDDSR